MMSWGYDFLRKGMVVEMGTSLERRHRKTNAWNKPGPFHSSLLGPHQSSIQFPDGWCQGLRVLTPCICSLLPSHATYTLFSPSSNNIFKVAVKKKRNEVSLKGKTENLERGTWEGMCHRSALLMVTGSWVGFSKREQWDENVMFIDQLFFPHVSLCCLSAEGWDQDQPPSSCLCTVSLSLKTFLLKI